MDKQLDQAAFISHYKACSPSFHRTHTFFPQPLPNLWQLFWRDIKNIA